MGSRITLTPTLSHKWERGQMRRTPLVSQPTDVDPDQTNAPSRSHLVATHFSPAVTGAPPCSVAVAAWARS